MINEEQQLMDQFGITCEQKLTFHFQGHRYARLEDALRYAEKVALDNVSAHSKGAK